MQLSLDLFEALAVVHDFNIVHNDVKSANYLVRGQGADLHAVLTDFGVCTVLDDANKVQGMTINTVTGKTMAYAAVETFSKAWHGLEP